MKFYNTLFLPSTTQFYQFATHLHAKFITFCKLFKHHQNWLIIFMHLSQILPLFIHFCIDQMSSHGILDEDLNCIHEMTDVHFNFKWLIVLIADSWKQLNRGEQRQKQIWGPLGWILWLLILLYNCKYGILSMMLSSEKPPTFTTMGRICL